MPPAANIGVQAPVKVRKIECRILWFVIDSQFFLLCIRLFGGIRCDDGNIILGSAAVIQVDCCLTSSLGITMNPVEILVD
jgi:hypothetical protein